MRLIIPDNRVVQQVESLCAGTPRNVLHADKNQNGRTKNTHANHQLLLVRHAKFYHTVGKSDKLIRFF